MQVSVETTRGLERKLTVTLPPEQFQKAYEDRLQKLSKTAKLAGFRPGKVPLKVVQQKFGRDVKQEILTDMVQRGYGEAIRQEKLKPAGYPQIDAKPPEQGQALQFTAIFEVYPEIKLSDLKKISVIQPNVAIGDADVDSLLEKLRKQRATWQVVERPARLDDQVQIDFEGTIDGQPFEGGEAEGFTLVLGSKRMIEDFEDQLVGIKPGEERKIKVKFPKDYGNDALQGKKAQFMVNCKSVQEQVLPAVDEEFVRSFGAEDGTIDTLRARLREHLLREVDENRKLYIKRQIMDGLLKQHKVDLPNVLVDQEIQQLQQQTFERLGLKEADMSQLPREPFEEEAKRRVTLGLLVGEIVKERQVKADPAEVKSLVEKTAANYQNPEQMVQYYLSNREAVQHFETLVIEEKVMDNLLAEAKKSEKTMSFDELLKANQEKK